MMYIIIAVELYHNPKFVGPVNVPYIAQNGDLVGLRGKNGAVAQPMCPGGACNAGGPGQRISG
jgi:hypothetical protein